MFDIYFKILYFKKITQIKKLKLFTTPVIGSVFTYAEKDGRQQTPHRPICKNAGICTPWVYDLSRCLLIN